MTSRPPPSDAAPPAPAATFSTALSAARPNSFGFLRWVMAVMVVIDHSYPLGGFNGGADPMWGWSRGQDSLGGIAVAGFFIMSGYLVCKSWFGSKGTGRFLWKRFLRIFPGFWVCLLVTAFVFAPVAWAHERGSWSWRFFSARQSPFDYVFNNLLLHMHQYGIDGLLSSTPYGRTAGGAFDGSLWTLIYEFKCYLLLAALGFVGLLASRRFVLGLTVAFYALTLTYAVNSHWDASLLPVLGDMYVARFGFLFLMGSVFALYSDRIRVNDRLGAASAVLALVTLHTGGWLLIGYPAFAYTLLWLAARLPLAGWDRFGDLSYGTYIYAFPVQMLLADWGLQSHGVAAFVIVSLAVTTGVAALSWHALEKRALRLKGLRRRRRPAGTRPRPAPARPRREAAPTGVAPTAAATADG